MPSTYEVKARLSAYLESVLRTGEPVVITRHGKPIARLVPEPAPPEPETVLAQMRTQAREQGLAYDWAAVNAPLGEETWGDSDLWPDLQ